MNHPELIRLIAQGNKQAFGELYEAFKARVYNTSLSYMHNTAEAEELTQDVFIEVYQSAANFKGESSVSTWIYRVTVNKCLDRLRYHNRKKRFASLVSIFGNTGEVVHDAPHFNHPGVLLENSENASILFKAIGQLPEQQKTAFLLSYVEDLPQKEVAEIMQVSVKAVESLIQRAKAKLRVELENFYPGRRK